jgi:hypothetical protein
VSVFYSKDVKYIAHWTERPALANTERAQITDQTKKDLPSASEQDLRAEVRKRTTVRYPIWQQETVKEIRRLLGRASGVS